MRSQCAWPFDERPENGLFAWARAIIGFAKVNSNNVERVIRGPPHKEKRDSEEYPQEAGQVSQ